MRKVDGLGRIVIPSHLRRKYGLTVGVAVEFLDGDEGDYAQTLKAVLQGLSRKDFRGRNASSVRKNASPKRSKATKKRNRVLL